MAGAGNILNGPNSPNFHEYEMMKAAEKTDVFRKRGKDSKEEVRQRKKEWLIVTIILVAAAIGTYILFNLNTGAAGAVDPTPVIQAYSNDDAIEFSSHIDQPEKDVLEFLRSRGVKTEAVSDLSEDASEHVYEMRGGIFGVNHRATITFAKYGTSKKYRLHSYTETLSANDWPKPESGDALSIQKAYRNLQTRYGGPSNSDPVLDDGENLLDPPGAKAFSWSIPIDKGECLLTMDITCHPGEKDGFQAAVSFRSTQ